MPYENHTNLCMYTQTCGKYIRTYQLTHTSSPSSDCTIMELVVLLYQYMSRESVFIATGLTAPYDCATPAPYIWDPLLVTNRSCSGGLTPTCVCVYMYVVRTCRWKEMERNVFACSHLFLTINFTNFSGLHLRVYMYVHVGRCIHGKKSVCVFLITEH